MAFWWSVGRPVWSLAAALVAVAAGSLLLRGRGPATGASPTERDTRGGPR